LARHCRQYDLRAGRRRGVADARLPDQVPRRLRSGDQEGGCMRIIVLFTALFMLFGAAAPLVAEAQPAPAGVAQPTARTTISRKTPHNDVIESSGKGMALLFWMMAVVSVAGALFVVTRRNLIAAVMGMVGSFIGVAAVYMMLYASFLAVIQMLVY